MAAAGVDRLRELQGLALGVLASQCSLVTNNLVKSASGVPVLQAMLLRFLLQFCVTGTASMLSRQQGAPVLFFGRPENWMYLLLRVLASTVGFLSLWSSFHLLPIGISVAILFVYPVLSAALAKFAFCEALDWRFWLQASACILGVLLLAGVGSVRSVYHLDGPHLRRDHGVALALLAAICFATVAVSHRALKESQLLEVQALSDGLMAFVTIPGALAVSGGAHDWSAWTSISVMQIMGATAAGLAYYWCTLVGSQRAPASKFALCWYVEVPSAFVAQVVAWREIPTAEELAGATLIVVAAVLRFWHEIMMVEDVEESTPLVHKDP